MEMELPRIQRHANSPNALLTEREKWIQGDNTFGAACSDKMAAGRRVRAIRAANGFRVILRRAAPAFRGGR